MASLSTRCIAEGLGTLLLVYFGAGAAAMTLMLAAGTKPAAAFNIGIGQLGGLADWFAIGMSFAIIIAVGIYALGRVSGTHFNPAVTIALLVTKRFPAGESVVYYFPVCWCSDREPALFPHRWDGCRYHRRTGSNGPVSRDWVRAGDPC